MVNKNEIKNIERESFHLENLLKGGFIYYEIVRKGN